MLCFRTFSVCACSPPVARPAVAVVVAAAADGYPFPDDLMARLYALWLLLRLLLCEALQVYRAWQLTIQPDNVTINVLNKLTDDISNAPTIN